MTSATGMWGRYNRCMGCFTTRVSSMQTSRDGSRRLSVQTRKGTRETVGYGKGATTVIIRTCSKAPRCGSMRTPTAALTTPTTRCARRRRTRARARFTTGRRTRGQQVCRSDAREALLLRSCLLLHLSLRWSGASSRFRAARRAALQAAQTAARPAEWTCRPGTPRS